MCASWALVIVSGFLLFILFGASTALGALDLKDGLGLWSPFPKWGPGAVSGAAVVTGAGKGEAAAPGAAGTGPATVDVEVGA